MLNPTIPTIVAAVWICVVYKIRLLLMLNFYLIDCERMEVSWNILSYVLFLNISSHQLLQNK